MLDISYFSSCLTGFILPFMVHKDQNVSDSTNHQNMLLRNLNFQKSFLISILYFTCSSTLKVPPHIFFLKVILKHQWFGAYTFYPLLDLCLFLSLHMKHPQTQSHLGSEPRLDWPLSRELHSLPNSSSLPEA